MFPSNKTVHDTELIVILEIIILFIIILKTHLTFKSVLFFSFTMPEVWKDRMLDANSRNQSAQAAVEQNVSAVH